MSRSACEYCGVYGCGLSAVLSDVSVMSVPCCPIDAVEQLATGRVACEVLAHQSGDELHPLLRLLDRRQVWGEHEVRHLPERRRRRHGLGRRDVEDGPAQRTVAQPRAQRV